MSTKQQNEYSIHTMREKKQPKWANINENQVK